MYALPYDPAYPVVCFDELPCLLIGDAVEPLALQSGQVRKEHYAYEKLRSCALLAANEPLTGRRVAQVHRQGTKPEYTLFFQDLAARFPSAKKIRVVQDNLNTYDISSFYEHLPADQGDELPASNSKQHKRVLPPPKRKASDPVRQCGVCYAPTWAQSGSAKGYWWEAGKQKLSVPCVDFTTCRLCAWIDWRTAR